MNAVAFADNTSQILFSGGDDGLCKVGFRSVGLRLDIMLLGEGYILKETSNAKPEPVLLEWTPSLCLRFML